MNISTFSLPFAPRRSLIRPDSCARVVYDCTVVLHYAGPNFKAYYRRGLAYNKLGAWTDAANGTLEEFACG